MSAQLIQIISDGLRNGLPHPGDVEAEHPPQLIFMPGMNMRGIPPEVADKMAKDAGLPSADLPKLVAEALINLITTVGEYEIVSKSELESLRAGKKKKAKKADKTEATAAPGVHQWATPHVQLAKTSAGKE